MAARGIPAPRRDRGSHTQHEHEAETIGEDARRAGPGTRLEVTVPRPTNDARLAAVRSLFEWLGTKGIDVIVREDEEEH